MPENTPMPHPLDLIVAYAATPDPACQASLQGLRLPHLQRLLARLSPAAQALAEPDPAQIPLSLPHERAWAQAWGLPDCNGHIPWGAWHAQQQGLLNTPNSGSGSGSAWALLVPCYWQVGTDHITVHDPAQLQLTQQDAQTLLEIVGPWLAEEGLQVQADTPTRWLMQGPLLADLPMPSLERVQGQDVRQWMQHQAQNPHISASQRRAMQVWQRLHSELQMLLYTHPFNDARQAQGLAPVNAFWLHGAGCLPQAAPVDAASVQCIQTLQTPAQNGDWQTWAKAWQALDAGPLAQWLDHIQTGGAARLTLCGPHTALTWHTAAPRSLSQRLSRLLRPVSFLEVAKKL